MSPHDPSDDPSGDALYQDPELAQFYDLANVWAADQETCRALAADAASLLDLGCGTGLLAARLAVEPDKERAVYGVDPAAAMLEIARRRPGGERVTWVQADARSVRLEHRFDLVVLTGHAFQVFLTDEDQRAALATIAAHLAPDGRFIFDSRNPAAEAWRDWIPEESEEEIAHPTLGAVASWNDMAHDPASGIVTYETHYRLRATGRVFSASSKIRFTPQETLAERLEEAGLAVDEWRGSWTGAPYRPDAREIIPLGRLR